MDELFGEAGFAQADKARKEKIENDIGLTALLNGTDPTAAGTFYEGKSDSMEGSDELKQ